MHLSSAIIPHHHLSSAITIDCSNRRMKDRQNLLAALQLLMDAVDPVKWLPAGFENANEGIYLALMKQTILQVDSEERSRYCLVHFLLWSFLNFVSL